MRWQGRRQSENVEDQRGVSVQRASIGAAPLLRLLPLLLRSRTGRYLLGGMVLVFVGAQFLGVDLSQLFLGGSTMPALAAELRVRRAGTGPVAPGRPRAG